MYRIIGKLHFVPRSDQLYIDECCEYYLSNLGYYNLVFFLDDYN